MGSVAWNSILRKLVRNSQVSVSTVLPVIICTPVSAPTPFAATPASPHWSPSWYWSSNHPISPSWYWSSLSHPAAPSYRGNESKISAGPHPLNESLSEICSESSLAYDGGFENCTTFCDDAQCCFADDDASCIYEVDLCLLFAPRQNVALSN